MGLGTCLIGRTLLGTARQVCSVSTRHATTAAATTAATAAAAAPSGAPRSEKLGQGERRR